MGEQGHLSPSHSMEVPMLPAAPARELCSHARNDLSTGMTPCDCRKSSLQTTPVLCQALWSSVLVPLPQGTRCCEPSDIELKCTCNNSRKLGLPCSLPPTSTAAAMPHAEAAGCFLPAVFFVLFLKHVRLRFPRWCHVGGRGNMRGSLQGAW